LARNEVMRSPLGTVHGAVHIKPGLKRLSWQVGFPVGRWGIARSPPRLVQSWADEAGWFLENATPLDAGALQGRLINQTIND